MTTFITSDVHLGHRNIQVYCPKFRAVMAPKEFDEHSRPVITDEMVDAMNEKIIENWNAKVGKGDHTIIVGDVLMGQLIRAPELIPRLNGSKSLVVGNHDRGLIRWMQKAGINFFDSVRDYREMGVEVDGKKNMVVMCHFPISHWNAMNQGSVMLHGHLHGSPSGLKGRIFDVGLDASPDFAPYVLEDIVREVLKNDVIRDHHDNEVEM